MSDYILHYGTKRHSGRYPWGSGENPYQNEPWYRGYRELEKQGLSEREIAEHFDMSMNEFRYRKSYAQNFDKAVQIANIKHLRYDRQMSVSAIAERTGISEANIRNWLKPDTEKRNAETRMIMDDLAKVVDEKGAIDVGKGVAQQLKVHPTKLDAALTILKDEGYQLVNIKVPQPKDPKHPTTMKILVSKELNLANDKEARKYCYQNLDKIEFPYELHYEDSGEGRTAANILYPMSIDSKRIMVKYSDKVYEDGYTGLDRDGLIQLRRGVEDISMGDNKYAQVRIAVDGDSYLKGMAVYSDDMPPGIDIIFNTNRTTKNPLKKDPNNPLEPVFKSMEKDPSTGEIDKDNPFGAQIESQLKKRDENGKEYLTSAVNIVNEEGRWGDWTSSKTLASQVLSKQSVSLAKQQLNLEYAKYQKEFDDIMRVENPTVRKNLLVKFADECDKAAVHLKAAALPRQSVNVLIPIPSMKDNEVYAPRYKDGEKIILIRYPHGGKFEIPELIVNNNNPEAKKVIGTDSDIDAIGINKKVADVLSGADFDGDTAVTIPNNNNYILTKSPLKQLENFDPKERYPERKGMTYMTKANTQLEMGKITNLITDMQINGSASDEELARAIRHSMVVIDAYKHKLDYELSYIDNDIASLKEKYQGGKNKGASTLISKASSKENVPERDETKERIDPVTGEKLYFETRRAYSYYRYEDGKKVYYDPDEKVPKGAKYDKLYPNQENYNTNPKKLVTQESTKMAERKDAYELSSGTKMEAVYADYANSMKAFANKARLASLEQKNLPYNPQAAIIFSDEVKSIEEKVKNAIMRAPINRQVTRTSDYIIQQKIKNNPQLYDKSPEGKKALKKLRNQVEARQRAKYGQKEKFEITEKEWQAVQAGALRVTTLNNLLKYANNDQIIEFAMPKDSNHPSMTSGDIALAKAMLNSGHTLADVAAALNVSTSTITKYASAKEK